MVSKRGFSTACVAAAWAGAASNRRRWCYEYRRHSPFSIQSFNKKQVIQYYFIEGLS